jgi:hypothetical protein
MEKETMEPTAKRKRLSTAVPWLIAVVAVAGAGVLLLVQNYRPAGGGRDTQPQQSGGRDTQPQQSGGSPLDGALAGYVAELQRAPDNQELREKIIKLAARASPVPEIPVQARDHHFQAGKLFEAAETINDVGKAVDEYQAALLIAPWWPEANRDLGLALMTAQRHDEAIAALRLYLAAGPEGPEAGAAREEIQKITAKRNSRFSMPLGIRTRCQIKFPALVADYWLYIDGRLVSAPPHPDIRHEYTQIALAPTQGYEFSDKEGMAAVVNPGGQIVYVRKGAEIYTAQTFDVEPGTHTLGFLLLNKTGFPLAVASADLELKTGDSKGYWFNMPADYVANEMPAAVVPFFVENTDWQQSFSWRQATVKKKIKAFADDPVVQALNQAKLGAAAAPAEHSRIWVDLPAEHGGKRELDGRLVAALLKYIADEHGIDEHATTWAPDDSPADYKDSLAKLLPLIRAHNRRIESLKELAGEDSDPAE